jgi:ribokinase
VIALVGSINLDIVVGVDRHPAPGETVLGDDRQELPGGKGANQAVAAARLGADVAFVGRVGDDDAGRRLRDGLAAEGVDVTHVRVDADAPTGVALIAVDRAGENTIVVSSGANARVSAADVEAAHDVLANAAVTLVQHEVPEDAVAAAIAAAGGTVVLNPAPARPIVAPVDVLVPNRGELETLAGRAGDPVELARGLEVARAVVVTLGSEGAVVVEGAHVERIPAPEVDAVDTTGAGDSFDAGFLAARLDGRPVADALAYAIACGSLSTRAPGGTDGQATRDEVEDWLREGGHAR